MQEILQGIGSSKSQASEHVSETLDWNCLGTDRSLHPGLWLMNWEGATVIAYQGKSDLALFAELVCRR